MHHSTLSCHKFVLAYAKMQSILALALSAPAAAFAPSAQPRASVVRFMDEDALKNKILNAGPAEFNKIGGVEVATEMPADIKFEVPIPAKVMGRWDGECAITVVGPRSKTWPPTLCVPTTPPA